MEYLLEDVPPYGVTLHEVDSQVIDLEIRSDLLSPLHLFLGFWLAGWNVGVIFMIHDVVRQFAFDIPGRVPWFLPVLFILFEVGPIKVLVDSLFRSVRIVVRENEMKIVITLLFFQRTFVLKKSDIKSVTCGGFGVGATGSRFADVKIHGTHNFQVLKMQTLELGQWLEKFLTLWTESPSRLSSPNSIGAGLE